MGVPPKIGRLTIYWGGLTGMNSIDCAVMFLSFRTDRSGWANSADPDQTAPKGAV